jgi:hypothetical protein
VTIVAKYQDGPSPKKPPQMKCPSCGKVMKFHGYLAEVALEPCEDELISEGRDC